MKIRTVKLLYTLKTENGYIPGGIYSTDSPKGIPEKVLDEVKRKRNTVQVLAYEQDVMEQSVEVDQDETALIDDQIADVQTEQTGRSRKRKSA